MFCAHFGLAKFNFIKPRDFLKISHNIKFNNIFLLTQTIGKRKLNNVKEETNGYAQHLYKRFSVWCF